MAKIVAVGKRAFVAALAGCGAEPAPCDTDETFAEALRRVALDREVTMVFVPETQADAAPEAVEAFQRRSAAALLSLPMTLGADRHPSLERVRFLVEQATGARLI